MPDEDITVGDLKSALKVMEVLADNAKRSRAYFKKNAVEEIIDYLEERIREIYRQQQADNQDEGE